MAYSITEFAQKIKSKYPDYQSMDDTDLVNKVVAKYPEYKSQIDFGISTSPQPITRSPSIGFGDLRREEAKMATPEPTPTAPSETTRIQTPTALPSVPEVKPEEAGKVLGAPKAKAEKPKTSIVKSLEVGAKDYASSLTDFFSTQVTGAAQYQLKDIEAQIANMEEQVRLHPKSMSAPVSLDQLKKEKVRIEKELEGKILTQEKLKSLTEAIDKSISPKDRQIAQNPQDFLTNKQNWKPENAFEIAHAMVASAAQSAPMTAASLLPAGQLTMIAGEGGNWSKQIKEKYGKLDDDILQKYQVVYGIPSGLIETYMDRLLLKPLKLTGLGNTALAQKFLPNAKDAIFKKLAKVALMNVGRGLGEGSEELAQSNWQDVTTYLALGEQAKRYRESGQIEKADNLVNQAKTEIDKIGLKGKTKEFILGALSGVVLGAPAGIAEATTSIKEGSPQKVNKDASLQALKETMIPGRKKALEGTKTVENVEIDGKTYEVTDLVKDGAPVLKEVKEEVPDLIPSQPITEEPTTAPIPKEKQSVIPLEFRNPLQNTEEELKTATDPKYRRSLEKNKAAETDQMFPGKAFKFSNVDDAIKFYEANNIPYSYVRADIQNLKGENDHAGSHEAANEHARKVVGDNYLSDITELGGITGRDQGDELKSVVPYVSPETLRQVIEQARQRGYEAAKKLGIDKLTHARYGIPNYGALDLMYGIVEGKPGKYGEMDREADELSEAMKREVLFAKAQKEGYIEDKESGKYVRSDKSQPPGPAAKPLKPEGSGIPIQEQVPQGAARGPKGAETVPEQKPTEVKPKRKEPPEEPAPSTIITPPPLPDLPPGFKSYGRDKDAGPTQKFDERGKPIVWYEALKSWGVKEKRKGQDQTQKDNNKVIREMLLDGRFAGEKPTETLTAEDLPEKFTVGGDEFVTEKVKLKSGPRKGKTIVRIKDGFTEEIDPTDTVYIDIAEGKKEEEKIVSAVVQIGDEIFEGANHGIAINKAEKSGAVKKDKSGHYVDRDGQDLWGTGWADLFKTNKGRILNRFQSDKLFNVTASENAPGLDDLNKTPLGSGQAQTPAQDEIRAEQERRTAKEKKQAAADKGLEDTPLSGSLREEADAEAATTNLFDQAEEKQKPKESQKETEAVKESPDKLGDTRDVARVKDATLVQKFTEENVEYQLWIAPDKRSIIRTYDLDGSDTVQSKVYPTDKESKTDFQELAKKLNGKIETLFTKSEEVKEPPRQQETPQPKKEEPAGKVPKFKKGDTVEYKDEVFTVSKDFHEGDYTLQLKNIDTGIGKTLSAKIAKTVELLTNDNKKDILEPEGEKPKKPKEGEQDELPIADKGTHEGTPTEAVRKDAEGRDIGSAPEEDREPGGRSVPGTGKGRDTSGLRGRNSARLHVPEIVSLDVPENKSETNSEFADPESFDKPSAPDQKVLNTDSLHNYHIPLKNTIGQGGDKAKFQKNLDAITLLKKIESENRKATPEEQDVLVQYVGWGGLKKVFDEKNPGNWEKEQKQLKAILTDAEWKSANFSTLNAHYTSIPAIRSMWKGLQRLGFTGGKVLEPSMGIGHFFGAIPEGLPVSLTGIELDDLTGRIATQLYQTADISIKGFEEFNGKLNSFASTITNVPFLENPTFDKNAKKYGIDKNLSLHNYFFEKSMALLEPGGVMAFITTHYTMDAKDPKVRNWLADRGNFLGAIRLPNTAFKDNAGTEVVTDIIYMQKRMEGETETEITKQFRKVEAIELDKVDGSGTMPVFINSYFVANPDMVLGKNTLSGTMYAENSYNVEPYENASIETQLEAAHQNLPLNVMEKFYAARTNEQTQNEIDQAKKEAELPTDETADPGTFFVIGEKIYFKNLDGKTEEPKILSIDRDNLKAQINIKNILKRVTSAQRLNDNEGFLEAQKELNDAYDSYIEKYGNLSNKNNYKIIRDDSQAERLLALEEMMPDGKMRKADIFTRKTAGKAELIEKADNIGDAVNASLLLTGRLDFAKISQMMGTTIEQAEAAALTAKIAFRDPKTKQVLYVNDYISGNVRVKLREAETAAKKDKQYESNISFLQKALPKWKDFNDFETPLGATFVQDKFNTDFAKMLFGTEQIKVHYVKETAKWVINYSGPGNAQINDTWGIDSRHNGIDLLSAALNGDVVTIHLPKVNPEDRPVVDKEKTDAAAGRIETMKQEYQAWLWQSKDRTTEIVNDFNELLNSNAYPTYDGVSIYGKDKPLPWANQSIKLYDHQLNAIWGAVQRATKKINTMLAHAVGAGKTFEMISIAMELRRMGIKKKPTIVMPNHLIQQWSEDFKKLYPNSKILVAEEHDMTPQNRKTFLNKIVTGDWDAVLIRATHFEAIPTSPSGQMQFLEEKKKLYMASYEEAYEASQKERRGRGAKTKDPTVRQIQLAIDRIDTKINELATARKDPGVIYFEDLGIDYLLVDEADNWKNLDYSTNLKALSMGSPEGAKKTLDLEMKMRLLRKATQGGYATFATGTPISRSMSEVYHMLRYLQPEDLEQLGMEGFDSWRRNYGVAVPSVELSVSGKDFVTRTRFRQFINMPSLMALLKKTWDIKTPAMLEKMGILKRGVNLPNVRRFVVTAPKTQLLDSFMENLSDREKKIKGQKPEPGADNVLVIARHGQEAALDLRMRMRSLPDSANSKLNTSVKLIQRLYKEHKDAGGVIFTDLKAPYSEGFDVLSEMKNKLVASGIPKGEVAFIWDAKNDEEKQQMYKDFNEGKIRILFGNTARLSAGANIQENLKWMIHLDPPHNPRDIEQQEGRIIRQGNKHKEVEIYNVVTEGTLDIWKWQMLALKSNTIDSVMSADNPEDVPREIQDELFDTISIAAMRDELYKRQAEATKKAKVLTSQRNFFEAKKRQAGIEADRLEGEIESMKDQNETRKELVKELGEIPEKGKNKVNANYEDYETEKDAVEPLREMWKTVANRSKSNNYRSKSQSAITYLGQEFRIIMEPSNATPGDLLYSIGWGPYGDLETYTDKIDGKKVDAYAKTVDVINDIRKALRHQKDQLKKIETKITQATKDAEEYRKQSKRDFPQEKEFQDSIAKLEQIIADVEMREFGWNSDLDKNQPKTLNDPEGYKVVEGKGNGEDFLEITEEEVRPLADLKQGKFYVFGISGSKISGPADTEEKAIQTANRKTAPKPGQIIDWETEDITDKAALKKMMDEDKALKETIEEITVDLSGKKPEEPITQQFLKSGAARTYRVADITEKVLQTISPEARQRVNVRIVNAYQKGTEGRWVRFKDGEEATFWVDPKTGAMNVYIKPTANKVHALLHEILGHYGARNVLSSNPELLSILKKNYEADKGSAFFKNLKSRYSELSDDRLFDEWLAERISQRKNEDLTAAEKGIIARISNIIKRWLEKIGLRGSELDKTLAGLLDAMAQAKPYMAEAEPAFAMERTKVDPFFSPTVKAVEALKQEKGTGEQFFNQITKAPGVKEAEWKWMGLDDFLKGKASVTKAEVLDFVRQNQVVMEEVEHGGEKKFDEQLLRQEMIANDWDEKDAIESAKDYGLMLANPKTSEMAKMELSEKGFVEDDYLTPIGTKYSQYVLPGGENYREVLLKIPWNKRFGTESVGKEGEYEFFVKPPPDWKPKDAFEAIRYRDRLEPEKQGWSFQSRGYNKENYEREAETYRKKGWQAEIRPTRQWKNLEKDAFISSHWSEPNVFAHARLNDRVGPNGEKVLFIEEIQSDWAREAREKGIQEEKKIEYTYKVGDHVRVYANGREIGSTLLDAVKADNITPEQWFNSFVRRQSPRMTEGVPPQPFLKNWQEVALKRILRMAAEEGYDRVAWINGEQTADRYDLSKQVKEIGWAKNQDGTYDLSIRGLNGEEAGTFDKLSPKKMEETIGKDPARKIIESRPEEKIAGKEVGTLTGDDLRIGGVWATNLYDKQVPDIMNKIGKKFGSIVQPVNISEDAKIKKRGSMYYVIGESGNELGPIHNTEEKAQNWINENAKTMKQMSLPITDSMRESVLYEGQPLFLKTGESEPSEDETAKPLSEKKRKFLARAKADETASKDERDAINAIFPETYKVLSNEESISKAEAEVAKSPEAAASKVFNDDPISAEKSAIAIVLLRKYREDGNVDAEVRLVDHYDKQLRDAGRSIQAASLWAAMSPNAILKEVEKEAQNRGIKLDEADMDEIKAKKRLLDSIKDDTERMKKTAELWEFVAELIPPSKMDWLDAYRYTNMLSGPRTTLRNLYSNALNSFVSYPVSLAARGRPIEAARYLKDAIQAHGKAYGRFMDVLSRRDMQTGRKYEDLGEWSALQIAQRSKLPRVLTFIGDFLEAQDKYFSTMIEAGETYRLVWTGKNGKDARKEASELAERFLLRQSSGSKEGDAIIVNAISEIGKWIEKGRRLPYVGKPFGWFVPFVRVPINWAKLGVKATPLGYLGKNVSAENIGIANVGSAVVLTGAIMALLGMTTWGPPPDEEGKKAFYTSGRRPYSVFINGKWVPMWYFGPFAMSLALPAAIRDTFYDNPNTVNEGHTEQVFKVLNGMAKFFANQTPLAGVAGFFGALTGEDDYTFTRQAVSTIGQLKPAASLIRWVNQIADPTFRKADGFVQQLTVDYPMPGVERAKARETALGEESKREPSDIYAPFGIGTPNAAGESLYQLQQKYRKALILTRKEDDKEIKPADLGKLYILKDATTQIRELRKQMQASPNKDKLKQDIKDIADKALESIKDEKKVKLTRLAREWNKGILKFVKARDEAKLSPEEVEELRAMIRSIEKNNAKKEIENLEEEE